MSTNDGNTLGKNDPLIRKLLTLEETLWTNPNYFKKNQTTKKSSITIEDIQEAEERLQRFAPYIAKVFPETRAAGGLIESKLTSIPKMKGYLEKIYQVPIHGRLLLKRDDQLPISGSIKARGGIYEVLKHAESLAIRHGLLKTEDNYAILDSEKFKTFFSNFSIAVGSTGNLGLSIGIMSAQIGLSVKVHMSHDAKQWKKDLLREKGAEVVEYKTDYSLAVEEGRKEAEKDPTCYFIDDENSKDLFLGYATSALRLKKQLDDSNVTIDAAHPLFVYLPCGVGGGPGGVAFGLKTLYQESVHCFFAEPTHAPCMLLGLSTGLHDQISVQDIGLDNKTDADGLAVGRPSGFVGKLIEPFISGCYTVSDTTLYRLLSSLIQTEGIYLEPSALAGMLGPIQLLKNGQSYLKTNDLMNKMKKGTHIVWATGGSMVPAEIMKEYDKKGQALLGKK
ncbi:D-serine ammonia-lyase [Terrilactibacillus sp. BCM23-1]|uniref:Probable D-serine dehydratase n=1 Tax=Terrilactibacillus tamarindi TaxID=2599694 RepID=A0A6N8CT62_9BACI|nr:D-serine ammonia-lyase [Terrilactibacillus tamarindi]MTT31176.1 D-serine ammonia-lyase [Terrilactibacillus tamarindi]